MNNFKLKLKFEGRTLVEQEGNNISDFDNLMKGLKEKFDGHKGKRRK